jgi:hypothetical protein
MSKLPAEPPRASLTVSVLRGALAPLLRRCADAYRQLYFRVVEGAGYHKRDLLAGRVEAARDEFAAAKEQFQSALEKFSALTYFEGGELESCYYRLKSELDYSKTRADGVRDRIEAIQTVGDALFEEWRQELEQYSHRGLKANSRQQMRLTQQQYSQLLTAMRRVESRTGPVLAAFQDQVLYLKHNLNAQAILALEDELRLVSLNVSSLILSMDRSIQEADVFMRALARDKSLPEK